MSSAQVSAYVQGVLRLVVGEIGRRTAVRFALVSLLAVFLDLLLFRALLPTQAGAAGAQAISFLVASVATYIGHARWGMLGAQPGAARWDWKTNLRYLAVALMAFSLRGAVLGQAAQAQLAWIYILPLAIGLAAFVQYLGSFFFVFPTLEARAGSGLRWRLAVVGLFVYLFVLRLGYLGLPTLLAEEAYYWNYAQHLDLSYLDHPPMVAVLIAAGTWVFGDTEFGVRIPALLCSLVWTWFGYRMALNLFDRTVALRSALLLAALPLFFCYGFFITPDSPLLACWAGALFFLERALLGAERRAWYGVGVCLGLGLLSKYTIILLIPATLLFVVFDPRSRIWLARKEPYLALALAALIFSPVVIWNATHEWASFAFQGPRRMAAESNFGLHVLIGSIVLLLGPTAFAAAIKALRSIARRPDGAAEVVGERSRILFARLLLLLPVLVFTLFSLTHSPKLNWTGPAWLVLLPWIVYHTMDDRRREPGARRSLLARSWSPTFAATAVIYGLALQLLINGLPGRDFPPRMSMFGWEDLAAQVETLEHEIERESGEKPLVIGMDKYNIASELAFYRTNLNRNAQASERLEGVQSTTGRQWFGKQSLMFGYWSLEGPTRGRTLILVDDDPRDLSLEIVTNSFERMSPVLEFETQQNGKNSQVFYYRIGYGFEQPVL
jgi:dolichol-phosphate mannosyltransferase